MKEIKLRALKPKNVQPSKPKILIYGASDMGKSLECVKAPGVFYIDSEGTAKKSKYLDHLYKNGGDYMGVDEGALDCQVILEQIKALATQKHQYKTVVIDSISHVYNTATALEAERLGDKNAYGADQKPAKCFMRSLLNWMSRIDMNFILIAQEKRRYEQGNDTGTTYDCWEKVSYLLDLTLNIYRVGNERKARVHRSRLDQFPENIIFDWSFDEFANRYGKDIIYKDCEQIEIATPEQISRVNNLLSKVKLEEGQVDKWLAAYRVESWQEMSKDSIQKAIAYIEKEFYNLEESIA